MTPRSGDAAEAYVYPDALNSIETKASPFLEPRNGQNGTSGCGSKDPHGDLILLIPDFKPKKRYKLMCEFGTGNRALYSGMTTAKVSEFCTVKA